MGRENTEAFAVFRFMKSDECSSWGFDLIQRRLITVNVIFARGDGSQFEAAVMGDSEV